MEDSVDTYGVGARNCEEQEETSIMVHTEATESNLMEWTDEKHSLYLKSMEATFVNQLYKSLDFLGRDMQKNYPSAGSRLSKHKQPSTRAPSSQFKVLRDGCWSKINFRRDEAEVNEDESRLLLANPWIQHYRCPERQPIRKFLASRAKDPLATTANQHSEVWSQSCVGTKTEASGQNFNDEDLEEEKSDRIHEMKRTRTSADTVLNNDQVVPFENTVQVDEAAED